MISLDELLWGTQCLYNFVMECLSFLPHLTQNLHPETFKLKSHMIYFYKISFKVIIVIIVHSRLSEQDSL